MSLSPRQIAAHWVPGFVMLGLIFLIDLKNGGRLTQFIQSLHWNSGLAVIVAVAAGFVAGNFLDSLRDWIDTGIGRRFPNREIAWEFLLEADADKVQREDDYYFTSYVLSANLVIGVFLIGIADLFFPHWFSLWVWIPLILGFVVFGQDAWRLRWCIVKNSNELLEEARGIKRLPHEKVYTRLRPSKTHGVGVFAIRRIKKGASIFPDDDAPIKWVPEGELQGLPPELRQLYNDFSIIKDNGENYGCPRSFNQLTVSWFLNRPPPGEPNVGCRDDYTFYALRDIAVDEELIVDYRTFSEDPPS